MSDTISTTNITSSISSETNDVIESSNTSMNVTIISSSTTSTSSTSSTVDNESSTTSTQSITTNVTKDGSSGIVQPSTQDDIKSEIIPIENPAQIETTQTETSDSILPQLNAVETSQEIIPESTAQIPIETVIPVVPDIPVISLDSTTESSKDSSEESSKELSLEPPSTNQALETSVEKQVEQPADPPITLEPAQSSQSIELISPIPPVPEIPSAQVIQVPDADASTDIIPSLLPETNTDASTTIPVGNSTNSFLDSLVPLDPEEGMKYDQKPAPLSASPDIALTEHAASNLWKDIGDIKRNGDADIKLKASSKPYVVDSLGMMNPRIGEIDIKNAVDVLRSDMVSSYELRYKNHSPHPLTHHVPPSIPSASLSHSLVSVVVSDSFQDGFIVLQWKALNENGTLISSFDQPCIAFIGPVENVTITIPPSSPWYVKLRNKTNTDLIVEAIDQLTHDHTSGKRNKQLLVTKLNHTSGEAEQVQATDTLAQLQAADIMAALADIESNPHAYLQQLGSVDQKTAGTCSISNSLHTSNFSNWSSEGQAVYESDRIHEQLWIFYTFWISEYELLRISMNPSVQIYPMVFAFWDVQTLYFQDSYESLYHSPEQGFMTSLVLICQDAGSYTIHHRDASSLNTGVLPYTTLVSPNTFKLMLHFQHKQETAGGYIMHRMFSHSDESSSVNESIFGQDQSQLMALMTMYKHFIWNIRCEMHLKN